MAVRVGALLDSAGLKQAQQLGFRVTIYGIDGGAGRGLASSAQ
jgi:hypothetical protein